MRRNFSSVKGAGFSRAFQEAAAQPDTSPKAHQAPKLPDELPAIQSTNLSAWSLLRIELHGDERREVLVWEAKTRDEAYRVANSQKFLTIGRHWRQPRQGFTNWQMPKRVA